MVWMTPLLKAKLRPPSHGVDCIIRPRLDLPASVPGTTALVTIEAPAGSGKSTLLQQWYFDARKRGATAVWISLDRQDNNLYSVLRLICAGVSDVFPNQVDELSAYLDRHAVIVPDDAFTTLLNGLMGLATPLMIFIDDVHYLDTPEVVGGLQFALRYLPAGTAFIMASRHALPFARHRLRGRVQSYGWYDLRFNESEVLEYFSAAYDLSLSDSQRRSILRATEGWAAGLHLAALNMTNGHGEDSTPWPAVPRKDISDYLMEEVFARQPAEVQDFLLATAPLNRFCGRLADRVLGRPGGAGVIERLRRTNLFLFSLDAEGLWYRYHHLFTEFLRRGLEEREPGRTPAILAEASAWYEAQGDLDEAYHYALAAGQDDRAAVLLSKHGRMLFSRSRYTEIAHLFRRLPGEVLGRHPNLYLLHGWSSAYLGDTDRAASDIEMARAAARTGLDDPALADRIDAEATVLRTALDVIRTDEPDLSRDYDRLTERFAADDVNMRSYAEVILGYVDRARNDLASAYAHYRTAVDYAARSHRAMAVMLSDFGLASTTYLMGDLQESMGIAVRGLALAEREGWEHYASTGFLRVIKALIHVDALRIEDAQAELDRAIRDLEDGSTHGFLGIALIDRARLDLLTGNVAACQALLERGDILAERHNMTRVRFRGTLLRARLLAGQGRLDAALDAIAPHLSDPDGPISEKAEFARVEACRIAAATGRWNEVRRWAARLEDSARTTRRALHLPEVRLLEALARRAGGLGADLGGVLRGLIADN
ncbi:MAG: hypothetical protein KDE22_16690, partial [Rhodobacterales bacterium]|nr:hypothetical protein [Rhodobacterales bacterium]